VRTVSSDLHALCFDADDPAALARFWAGVLGREVVDDPYDGLSLPPGEPGELRLRFQPADTPKSGPNRMHFDLTSASLEDQQATIDRALGLGARLIDVGQLPEEDHEVLADPEGNEFCVIGPGNDFTAGCGFVGALSCDGSQAVGYFWSKALDWSLVWDQDEETAIQSPRGGSKIAWGGPPVAPKDGKNRLHFDLVTTGDRVAEVERLVSLGARRIHIGQHDDQIVLADPDDNEFCVRPR
jgi:catechol 2,3-dioxygenase-like lactoylglutathione lyase family enzyme